MQRKLLSVSFITQQHSNAAKRYTDIKHVAAAAVMTFCMCQYLRDLELKLANIKSEVASIR